MDRSVKDAIISNVILEFLSSDANVFISGDLTFSLFIAEQPDHTINHKILKKFCITLTEWINFLTGDDLYFKTEP